MSSTFLGQDKGKYFTQNGKQVLGLSSIFRKAIRKSSTGWQHENVVVGIGRYILGKLFINSSMGWHSQI